MVTMLMTTLVLAQAVPAGDGAQEPTASMRASFAPVTLSAKYVLISGQRDQVPPYQFRRESDGSPCTARLNTAELSLTSAGQYELKMQYQYSCPRGGGVTPRFTSYDRGDFVLAPDGLVFIHDASQNRQRGMNLLGAFEATFDHALAYAGVRTVQEARGDRRAFEALLIGVHRTAADQGGGRQRPVMLWFVPDEISGSFAPGPERLVASAPGERLWMPAIRAIQRSARGADGQIWIAGEQCHAWFDQPDSLWLVSGGRAPLRGGISALASGRWLPVTMPTRADTVPLLHVGFECDDGERMTVVAERFGRFIAVDTGLFSAVTTEGRVHEGVVRRRAGDAMLRPAALQIACSDSPPCRVAILDADTLAITIRTENVARAGADRERREREVRQAVAAEEARRRARFVDAGATGEQLSAALAGRVTPGMSQRLVQAILGTPQRTEEQATELGTVVVWYYPGRVVEFSGGRVRAVR